MNLLAGPDGERAVGVVVVTPDACRSRDVSEMYVGLAFPIVASDGGPGGPTYGADRTVFYETWPPPEPATAALLQTMPPSEGFYVNVFARHHSSIDRATGKISIQRAIDARGALPRAQFGIHAVAGEIERDALELQLRPKSPPSSP